MLDLRQTSVIEKVMEHNRKIRMMNLCRDCFTDDTYTFQTRLDAFGKAYDLWNEGSIERDMLIRQYPVLVNMLRMNRAKME